MKILGVILFGLLLTTPAQALTILWDLNTEPDMLEYRLYTCIDDMFAAPGCKVPVATIPHPTNTYTVEEVGIGYSLLTAVDTDGDESGPSNMINNVPPAPVINFRIEGTLTILP